MSAPDKDGTGPASKNGTFDARPSYSETIDSAIRYLIARQREDGGWGEFEDGESTVYSTSLVSFFLKPFEQSHQLADTLSKACLYILRKQGEDGQFGTSPAELLETALATLALSGKEGDAPIKKAFDYLLAKRLADGSWNNDPVCTVLVTTALCSRGAHRIETVSLSEEIESDDGRTKVWVPSKDAGAVKGQIVDVSTGAPITGTTVFVKSDPNLKDISDESGYFLIGEVTPGPQKIKVMTSDYMQQVILIDVERESVADLGVISLAPLSAFEFVDFGKNPNEGQPDRDVKKDQKRKVSLAIRRKREDHDPKLPAYINGNVFDLVTKRPIGKASVVFAGRAPVTTDDQGTFFIRNVEAGECQINISSDGYREQLYTGSIHSGQVKDILVYLTPERVDHTSEELSAPIRDIESTDFDNESPLTNSAASDETETYGRQPNASLDITQACEPAIIDGGIRFNIWLRASKTQGKPALLSAYTNSAGDRITLCCDRPMSSPGEKYSSFVAHVNGREHATITTSVNRSDSTKVDLALSTPIRAGQTVTLTHVVDYAHSSGDHELSAFLEYPVVNNVLPLLHAQDGFGYSGLIAGKPIAETVFMSAFNQWPSGFYKNVLAFAGAVYDGQHIWMIPANADSVIRISKETGVMKSYNNWPPGFRKGNLSFEGGVFDGQHIWMIPANADSVLRIDKDSGVMTEYKDWPPDFKKGGHAFAGGVFDGQYVWMVPSYAESVVKVDTGTGVMTGYNNWPASFKKGGYAFAGGVFDGQCIWMIPANADSIVKIDKDTGVMTEYNSWPFEFKKGSHAFAGGVFDGQRVWMVPYYADRVVTVDSVTGEMSWFHQRPTEFTNVEYAFTGGVFDGENVWLIPLNADSVVRINTITGSIKGLNHWPVGFSKGVNAFSGGVFDGEAIWMIPSSADKVVRFSSFSQLSVSSNITSNDYFNLYISQDKSNEGLFSGHGNNWSSVYSFNSKLVPGVTNYLHIKCVDQTGPVAGLIGDFTLNDQKFSFENHTQHCVTGEDCWNVYTDKFGGNVEQISPICKNGMGKWSTRFGIDLNAQWIWTNWGKDYDTRYFSTPIYYSPEPSDILTNVRVVTSLPSNNVVIEENSFTKEPDIITKDAGKTLIEWRFGKVEVNKMEGLSFSLRLKDVVPGSETYISHGTEVYYEDANGRQVKTELGPCIVPVPEAVASSRQNESLRQTGAVEDIDKEQTSADMSTGSEKVAPRPVESIQETEHADLAESLPVRDTEEEIKYLCSGKINVQPNPVYQGLAVNITYKIDKACLKTSENVVYSIDVANVVTGETKKTFDVQFKSERTNVAEGNFVLSMTGFTPGRYEAVLNAGEEKTARQSVARAEFEVRQIDVIVT